MIRGIAFDFDGVLVESVDVKTRAYARMFEEYGADIVSKVVDYHLTNGGGYPALLSSGSFIVRY